ncbi:hypothetical protein ACWOE5_07700 [Aerococcus sanguinicola]|uniref:Uncharacterized protein n=1 Tax=Aerococcus sanguinicola TaxID=119206 RepID=A0A0X8FAU1_9LACT|nr:MULTISPECIES: hypothetical protein [Aerococcus]AMB93950.1 hypothetical protein AWM72_03830 [Aerococcus sanguinicola]MDK7050580.1 hypothetical protein [Aerococcus sanguinicola]OFT97388.1 hypothetical protein HMPREF3090_00995 [Aerococcus sp. HMSC23C02]PKZ21100.1 hypothetical protein CYJ28_07905 [Aerococcus sanguinicola]
MKRYTVTADVNSEKFGKGTLLAELNEDDFIRYANLSDQEKLDFLKEKDARFQVDVNDLEDKDVANYSVKASENTPSRPSASEQPRVSRKMRVNVNGQDTGWVDVTEENQAQYDAMMDRFNQMHQRFNQEFNNFFPNFRRGNFLDLGRPFFESLSAPQSQDQASEDKDQDQADKEDSGDSEKKETTEK